MSLEINPFPTIAAEVVGLDVRSEFDDSIRATLYEAWLQYGVLVFRDTGAGTAEQLRLSSVFGSLEEHPVAEIRVDGEPRLIRIPSDGVRDQLGF